MDSLVLILLLGGVLSLIGKLLYVASKKITTNNKIRWLAALTPAALFIFWIANQTISEWNLANDLYKQGLCDTHAECSQIAGNILRRGNNR